MGTVDGPEAASGHVRTPALVAGLLFVFSTVEAIYHAFGVRFHASPLNEFWELLDPKLLQTDLVRSIWYLHSQPPLFNLSVGIVLKLAGSHAAAAFHLLYLACGFGMYVGLVLLMQRLEVR